MREKYLIYKADIDVLEDGIDGIEMCSMYVYWLPCAGIFDCKNMSPGSGFELKIK